MIEPGAEIVGIEARGEGRFRVYLQLRTAEAGRYVTVCLDAVRRMDELRVHWPNIPPNPPHHPNRLPLTEPSGLLRSDVEQLVADAIAEHGR